MGYESASKLGYPLTLAALFCAARGFTLAGMPGAAEGAQCAMYLTLAAQAPVNTMIAELSSRKLTGANIKLAAQVAFFAGKAHVAELKTLASVPEAIAGWVGAKTLKEKLFRFTRACDRRARELKDQGLRKSLESPERLSEVGAWRMAREFMDRGMPGQAAKIWLARPFNPEWSVKWSYRGEKGETSFKEALKAASTRPSRAKEGAFAEETARLMEAAMERLELGAVAASPAASPASPGPAKKRL